MIGLQNLNFIDFKSELSSNSDKTEREAFIRNSYPFLYIVCLKKMQKDQEAIAYMKQCETLKDGN